MAEEQKVVTSNEEVKAPEQKERAPRARGDRKPNGKGPRKFNKNGPRREEKIYEERVVAINRVSKTVKGGRKMKFSALVVVGDRKGKYGFGTGKAAEVPEAIRKAVDAATKNIARMPIVKNDTIPHDIIGKFGATRVFLKPAKEGTGIIAGGPVRSILELAGIKNVCSKVYGSRTPINIIRATDNAIRNLKTYTKIQELRK